MNQDWSYAIARRPHPFDKLRAGSNPLVLSLPKEGEGIIERP